MLFAVATAGAHQVLICLQPGVQDEAGTEDGWMDE